MKNLRVAVAVVFGLMAQLNAWASDVAHPYACVINFERKNHPFSTTLEGTLSDMEGVRLVNEARPTDILQCLDDGAVTVQIIGHAADLESEKQVTAPLVYFRELHGQERQNFLDQVQKQLDQEVAEFNEKVRTNRLRSTDGSYYYKILQQDERVRAVPQDRPVYDQPRLVENQIWKRILEKPENLRKISIVSCLPEKVAAYYPELKELQRQGIEVEFGPINGFLSFLMGKNVASPDYDWLRKNLSESRPDERFSEQALKSLPADASNAAEIPTTSSSGSAR